MWTPRYVPRFGSTTPAFETIGSVGSYAPPKPAGKYRGAGVGPSAAYSYSAAVAEVEVDPETGVTQVVSYCAVDDCGVVINHAIVEGQLHGGVMQGAGQVFGEKVVYDPDSGQNLTASFQDYYMPRAGLIPGIRGEEHATESKVSPLGSRASENRGALPRFRCWSRP